ncbi:MAG: glycosyltransferase [Desulfobacteraceae bacterium]|jgi:glycosyltransferase involved in cell wall biosynthesis|nr:MAG: glycosyltransferase [Desulfobacteraceae bacterium]
MRVEGLPHPQGKTGWPWTEADQIEKPDPNTLSVSVVTPSYNQAKYLEETIRSVLLQGYPNLEYMVFDGGSTDNTLEIIKKYDKWLTYWESVPDKGQADAISKGWLRTSGSILAYLNSDDLYLPGAITRAVSVFKEHPDAAAVCGGEILINSEGLVMLERSVKSASLSDLLNLHFLPQPSVFISRSALERVGYLNTSFKNSFDFDLWIRLAQSEKIVCIPTVLAATRIHANTKTLTSRKQITKEIKTIIQGFLNSSEGVNLGNKEKREIKANLHILALGIALDNPLRSAWEVVSNSISAAVLKPSKAPTILRQILFRIRENNRDNPWGLCTTNIHISKWKPGNSHDH